MKHASSRRLVYTLSSIAIAVSGCAASDEDLNDSEQEATIPGRWLLPAAVRAVAQTQFVVVDGSPPWDGGAHCSGTFYSGTQKLKAYLLARYPGVSSIGGYDCRPNSANEAETSIHGTGRALDVMIPTIGGDADNTVGDEIANALITHAEEIGIQLVIWDRSIWQANLSGDKLRAYGGPIPHTNHLHVELNKSAAEREETPFFRNGIIQITAGDVNGDGHGDLLARKPDGTLWYYANGGSATAPFSTGALVGTGWSMFDRVFAADISGDGHADLVARKPDGTLWYYANGFTAHPTSPYSTGAQIGGGWEVFNSVVAADLSGDGYDDLVASRPDGTLWYYANNFTAHPTSPFGTGALIGGGWSMYNKLMPADLNGDGFVDMLAIKPDGTLWYYVNSKNPAAPFATGALIGSGWTVFNTVIAGDLGGDGFSDLVATRPDGTLWSYTHSGNPSAAYSTGALIGGGWTIFQR